MTSSLETELVGVFSREKIREEISNENVDKWGSIQTHTRLTAHCPGLSG